MSKKKKAVAEKQPVINESYELVATDRLTPHPRNVNRGDLVAIGGSIAENGFYGAVVAQKSTGHILAGNHRYDAAKAAGIAEVPVTWVDVDDDRALRILLADNRTTRLGHDDQEALAALLQEILADTETLAGTGFDETALDELLAEVGVTECEPDGLTDEDAVPEPLSFPITEPGDLWVLGKHRLLCGDSTSIDAVDRLIDGDRITFVFTDPPYGVGFRYSEHADDGGEEYAQFMQDIWHVLKSLHCPVVLTPGNNNVPLWMSFGDFKMACWIKKNAMSPASIAHLNIFEILLLSGVKKKRNTDLFEYPIKQQQGVGDHPCPKLLELVEDAIESWADPGATLFEPFGGSGSTLIACEKTNRKAMLMELDPKYCDVIVRRWQDFTGKEAVLESDGRTFNKISAQRNPEAAAA